MDFSLQSRTIYGSFGAFRVAILILMDFSLQSLKCLQAGASNYDVTIIILMDFSLQYQKNLKNIWKVKDVTILILVDFPLQYLKNVGSRRKRRRNPYFSGLSPAICWIEDEEDE